MTRADTTYVSQTSNQLPTLHELRFVREIMRVSESTLAREIRHGHLPVVRIGGRTLVDERDLLAYIESRRQRGPDHSPLPFHDDDPPASGPPVPSSPADASDGHGSG